VNYKYANNPSIESRIGAFFYKYGGVEDYLGWYTQGGKTLTVAYVLGTHGTPPVSSSYIHESTFEDNNRNTWVEWNLWGISGTPITATFYGKLTGTSAWTTRPKIGFYDPSKQFMVAGEILSESSVMTNDTNWQTITLTYTPSANMPITFRMQGVGGTSGGAGTEKLYWFHALSGGGGGAVSISPFGGNIG
jgi:hypothetical protein